MMLKTIVAGELMYSIIVSVAYCTVLYLSVAYCTF